MKKYILFAFAVFLSTSQLSTAKQVFTSKKSANVKEGYHTYWVSRPKGCTGPYCGDSLSHLCNPGDKLTGAGMCDDNDQTGTCECSINPLCTTVIIDYESGSHWYASAWYIPCEQSVETTFHVNDWSNNQVKIESGSKFSIGVAASKNSLLEVNPTGNTYHIMCGGSTVSSAKCWPVPQGTTPSNKKSPKPK